MIPATSGKTKRISTLNPTPLTTVIILILLSFFIALPFKAVAAQIPTNSPQMPLIRTDMTMKLSREIQEKMLSRIPLGKLGEAADAANVVLFLAMPSAILPEKLLSLIAA